MNKHNYLRLLVALLMLCMIAPSMAQSPTKQAQKEVRIKRKSGKAGGVRLYIGISDENSEDSFQKSYSSLEAMRADSSLMAFMKENDINEDILEKAPADTEERYSFDRDVIEDHHRHRDFHFRIPRIHLHTHPYAIEHTEEIVEEALEEAMEALEEALEEMEGHLSRYEKRLNRMKERMKKRSSKEDDA